MEELSSLESELFKETFEVKVYASECIQSGVELKSKIENLSFVLEELDIQIQEQVSNHYEDLLTQDSGVEKLESHLILMEKSVGTLLESAKKIKGKISEPYEKMKIQTLTLGRLQESCDLLRKIIRILQLINKLQNQLVDESNGLIKASMSLSEISELWTAELFGIDVIESHERVIYQTRSEVERRAESNLFKGLANQNQNQIGNALQVFYNLGILNSLITDKVFDTQVKEIKNKCTTLLDVKKMSVSDYISNRSEGPGGALLPSSSGNMASFRAAMWTNIEGLCDVIFGKNIEMIILQRILCKKVDPFTHVPYIENFPEKSRNILGNFWKYTLEILQRNLTFSATESNFMKQTLESEYPKLLRLINDLWSRLVVASTNSTHHSFTQYNPFTDKTNLMETLASFEQSYLSRSLSRLFDSINLLFDYKKEKKKKNGDEDDEFPKMQEIEEVFKRFRSELSLANVDSSLNSLVTKNIVKTVVYFCSKIEESYECDGDATQVLGSPTESQKRNVKAVNLCIYFKAGLLNTLVDSSDVIQASLSQLETAIQLAIDPLLTSIFDASEAIILTMHSELCKVESHFSSSSSSSCSLYMKELQGFLSRVSLDYLSHFRSKSDVLDYVRPLAHKIIEVFILNASLLRPLSKESQFILASDCAQLELSLEPLTFDKSGLSYSKLRVFRSLLFMKEEEILEVSELGSDIFPASIALHHLFSKAPPELKSPHESTGWSLSRYSNWLNEHPNERERLSFIQGALESYVAGTRLRQEKSYAFPYTIMLSILQKALHK